jgi:hypothetical protein
MFYMINYDVAEMATEEAFQHAQDAKERRKQAERAADAVESQAMKFKTECAHLSHQVASIDEALKTKGISLDYLLKRNKPVTTHPNNNDQEDQRPHNIMKKHRESLRPMKRPPKSTTNTTILIVPSSSSSSSSSSPDNRDEDISGKKQPSTRLPVIRSAKGNI